VVDPLDGLPDLRAGRVRFVGDPVLRIAEDGLRMLRFFRFHAWYGDATAGLDAAGLAACTAGRDLLDRLSRERVGAEMARLLAAPDPAPALAAMQAADILARVLPGADAGILPALVDLEARAGVAPRWQRRLVALGWREAWAGALRLSRADRRVLSETATALAGALSPAGAAWRHGADAARDAALIRAAEGGRLPPDLEAEIARGAAASFPLRAADLTAEGPALGAELRRLEEAWLASDLRLDAAALRSGPAVGPGSDD
jgi:poly(A) polymerase